MRVRTRWDWTFAILGSVLLFLVGYIHLALMVNQFGLHSRIGVLFLLNAIGAWVALVWILWKGRWPGWILGFLVSGGAAFAKLGMSSIPGLRALVFGRRGFPRRPLGGLGTHRFRHRPAPGGAPPFVGHHILPLPGSIATWGTVSVVIEVAFVVLTVVALLAQASHADGASLPGEV